MNRLTIEERRRIYLAQQRARDTASPTPFRNCRGLRPALGPGKAQVEALLLTL